MLKSCGNNDREKEQTDQVDMEIPDEELMQPLVQNEVTSPPPQPTGQIKSPPKRDVHPREQLRPTFFQHATAMMRSPIEEGEDEEKDNSSYNVKQQLPYAAPNVHPYAVPQYQPNIYGVGNGNSGWGGAQNRSDGNDSTATIDIVFSGMYTLAAAFTILQGFGMLIHFTCASSKCANGIIWSLMRANDVCVWRSRFGLLHNGIWYAHVLHVAH